MAIFERSSKDVPDDLKGSGECSTELDQDDFCPAAKYPFHFENCSSKRQEARKEGKERCRPGRGFITENQRKMLVKRKVE